MADKNDEFEMTLRIQENVKEFIVQCAHLNKNPLIEADNYDFEEGMWVLSMDDTLIYFDIDGETVQ